MKEPKIRLKGFTGEWKETTIGDVANVVGGGTPSTGNPVYWNGDIQWFTPSEVGRNKYVDKSERTITKIGLDESSARLLPENSILLSSRATIGEMSINTCKCATNQGFQSLLPHSADLEFLYSLMLTKKNELIRESNGSTFLEISASKVRDIEIAIPTKDEQEKVGEYFQNLDSLIQSTTKKIESLKQVKAASLQSLFPQEGETTPRVRFKGFVGNWEKKCLGDLYERSIVKNDLSFGTDKIISVANMYYIKPIKHIDDDYLKSYNVMRLGDIAFEGNKSKHFAHGRFVENTIGDGIVSHVFIVLKPINEQYDLNFWKYYINNEGIMGDILVRSTKSSTMMTDLVVDDFLKESLLVPSYEEQQQVGNFLSSLDSQIALLSQQLGKLQQIKSACLDNMFV